MVTRLNGAVLEIDAKLDGSDVTGVFELRKDYEVVDEVRRQFVAEGGEIGARLLGLTEGSTDYNRKRYAVDAGGGESRFEIRANLSETEFNGEYLQMGNDPTVTTTALSATGGSRGDQADVFQRFAEQATTDSLNPARLHISNYHDGTYSSDGEAGLFGSPRSVYIPETRIMTEFDKPSSADINVQCVVAGSLAEAVAKAEQEPW